VHLKNNPLFHLAFPVDDLNSTKDFYTKILGCKIGRSSETWIDFNFFGHQITAHLSVKRSDNNEVKNKVDGKNVPVRHFGLVMDWQDWHQMKDKLISYKTNFLIEPYLRFKGEIGEQATLFVSDPSLNVIELKSFKNKEMLFAS